MIIDIICIALCIFCIYQALCTPLQRNETRWFLAASLSLVVGAILAGVTK